MAGDRPIRVATRLSLISTIVVWVIAYFGAMLMTTPVLFSAIYLLSVFDPDGLSQIARYVAEIVVVGFGMIVWWHLKHKIAARWSR